MNIFWLDEDPEKAARYHCDKHVTKMCVEYAQVLSTAAHLEGFHQPDRMYKPVPNINPHIHNWAAESYENYVRLLKLAKALGDEYTHRYGDVHSSIEDVVSKIDLSEIDIDSKGFTDPYLAMDRHYKAGNYVESYRRYYIHGKDWKMSWFNRDKPEWYIGEVVEYEFP